jgi:hypothetical protein
MLYCSLVILEEGFATLKTTGFITRSYSGGLKKPVYNAVPLFAKVWF